jgi:hypothetical protein
MNFYYLSSYAAIFIEGNVDDNDSTIILANGSKTIDKVAITSKLSK